MDTSQKLLISMFLAVALSAPVHGEPASDDELTRQFMESPSLDALAGEFGKDFADFTVDDKKSVCEKIRGGSQVVAKQLPIKVDPATTLTSAIAVYSGEVCSYTFGYVLYEDIFLKMARAAMGEVGVTQYSMEFFETFYSTGQGYTELQNGLRQALMANAPLNTLAQIPFVDIRATYAVVGDNIKGFELKLGGE